jgi:pyruvate-ferredoxin/flavodoxin oxidoreductase
MQTCFFALSGLLPRDEAIAAIKAGIAESYGSRGGDVIERNYAAVDAALARLHHVSVPADASATRHRPPAVPAGAPGFVQRVTAAMLAGHGDLLPVSAFPVDGTWPVGTARWEKRNLATEIPVWDPAICIQCNKCALLCPHAAIRAKVYPPERIAGAPEGFLSVDYRAPAQDAHRGERYTLQVAPEDCTGCGLCVAVCPVEDRARPGHRAIDMTPQPERLDAERARYRFFLDLPEIERRTVHLDVKGSQLLEPLFEYPGACPGCGEAPYLKLLSQLFGDRLVIANATGCSSIFGGNLPTTPWCANADGRGPAWANSLFEDNAEFGLGLRVAIDRHTTEARSLLAKLRGELGGELCDALAAAHITDEAGIATQRERVVALRARLGALRSPHGDLAPWLRRLDELAGYLVPRSVWLVGGDGWAYDIGYGGLDHVLATGRKVNVLVLDTEVYSNTGGQQSKSTPRGAVAKFAARGKSTAKKDLGLLAMSYGDVYVARVALGARDAQTVHALLEAESYPGPSLVIAYSPCIAHGYDLAESAAHERLAVETGYWPLYRFDPRRAAAGESPLKLDAGPPRADVATYMAGEGRFRAVAAEDPARFRELLELARRDVARRQALYQELARALVPPTEPPQ